MDYVARRRRRSKTGGCLRFLLFIILLPGTVVFLWKSATTSANAVVSPLPDDYTPPPPIVRLFRRQKDPDQLRKLVKATVDESWNNYSIFVSDFNSNFSLGMNEASIYEAASVNKVPIVAALYAQAAKQEVDFSRTITTQASDIQDYGTGSIRYDPPGTTYSVKTLARLMMQKSDNTAAFLLAQYVLGLPTIQSYVNDWGLTQTDMDKNLTSNRDMAVLFKKIFDREITSDALSQELIDLLKDSDFEDRLPALLPQTTTVYHKIGTGVGGVHDVGVVVDGKLQYYIGVFTSDVPDEEQAAVLVAQVSKLVYEFMKS